MLKVLFFSHSSEIRGAEKSLELLIRYLDRSKFEPIVVMAGRGPLYDKIASQVAVVYDLTYYWWIPGVDRGLDYHLLNYQSLPKVVNSLREIIRRHRISLVHTNSVVVCGAALAACLERLPHVWHIREMIRAEGSGLVTPLGVDNTFTSVGALSNRVIAVSKAVKKDIEPAVPDEKIEVIYNGVELTQLSNSIIKTTRTRVKIAFVGNLIKRKGPDLFVEAGLRLLKTNPNVEFYLIGDCSDRELTNQIKNVIQTEGFEDHFNFLGFREDVLDILKTMDIYVLSSLNDPFPRSVIEAMAMECAIIATDCGGATEAIQLAGAGEVVPIEEESICQAMKRLTENPALRKKYAAAGLDAAKKWFSAEAYARNMETIFLKVLQEPIASSAILPLLKTYLPEGKNKWWKFL